MKHTRLALLLAAGLVLAVAVPALAQSEQPKPRKPRRVWTNEDFPERPKPAATEKPAVAQAPQEPASDELLFAELDQAREDLARWQQTADIYRRAIATEEQRLRDADNDYDRDAYARSLQASREQLAGAEAQVAELQARIAELEQLTAGKKRPAPKPEDAQKKNPAQIPPDKIPDNLVKPGAGPAPGKEPPPPPSS